MKKQNPKTEELPLPKDGRIPIPPMTRNWGQLACYVELDWKRGKVVSLLLHVPAFKGDKPTRVAYRIPCSSPVFHFSSSLDIAQTVDVGWCREHKKPCYGFYFPVGTRFIDLDMPCSSFFIRFEYVMAAKDEINDEEKRVIRLITHTDPKSYQGF